MDAFWWLLLTISFIFCNFILRASRGRRGLGHVKGKNASQPVSVPSPLRLPIIGHLYLFQGNPIIELSNLSSKYGEIYKLHLGTIETVVVSSLPMIKEVLLQKGSDFSDRTNFLRYNALFGNDKENSLAFCDWSNVQKTRRALARRFCHTGLFVDRIEVAISRTTEILINSIKRDLQTSPTPTTLKFHLQKACANIFFDFFCSEPVQDWEEDTEFSRVVRLFDEIFWEINQSHPTDVLPFLAPLFHSHLDQLARMGVDIRKFVIKRIIEPHSARLDPEEPQDFVDILLTHLCESDTKDRLTEEQVLYELEDFLGGHSAVSNLLSRALVEITRTPGMSTKIYTEHFIHKNEDYIQAVIYETLRLTCSPIVPHVASCDSSIGGYPIKKGTMVMINNYDLNNSPTLWPNPSQFLPERFLSDTGKFRRPSHFFPFSYGKRACMGYQLVEKVTAGLILSLVQHFDLHPFNQPNQFPIACVAIHPDENLNILLLPR